MLNTYERECEWARRERQTENKKGGERENAIIVDSSVQLIMSAVNYGKPDCEKKDGRKVVGRFYLLQQRRC